LDEQLVEQQAWAAKEAKAAAAVQTRFRSSYSRQKFKLKRDKACMLQRIFRGYEGRVQAWSRKTEILNHKQNLLFDYFAEVVQRRVRGYFSRKKKHDFHARRKYIDDMVSKSEELQQRLNQLAEETRKKDVEKAKAARERKIKDTSTQLHYLISTQAQRGVMNSPAGYRPTIDGVPVEQVITNNVKEYLKKNKLDLRKKLPAKRQFTKGSVLAAAPYDIVAERRRQEMKWSKLRRMSKKDFVAGTKARVPRYKRGIADGCEYIEPRTLKISTKEILSKQKHKYMSKDPFLNTVKTGRLFDEE
jgi:hypothetical protein